MPTLKYEDFLRLLEAHNPVMISEEVSTLAHRWTHYAYVLGDIGSRRTDRPDVREKLQRQLDQLLDECRDIVEGRVITLDNIKHVSDDEKERSETTFDSVAASYPGIDDVASGGYVLPGEQPSHVLLDKLIHKGAGTSMAIIEINRYRSYGDPQFLIDEMICNAYEHGNRHDRSKQVYLLWHRCPMGDEVHIIDQGEVEFGLNEQLEARRDLAASFGKEDDLSGLDLLMGHGDFRYFNICDGSKKKGTLLKIVIDQSSEHDGVPCEYIGHSLLPI